MLRDEETQPLFSTGEFNVPQFPNMNTIELWTFVNMKNIRMVNRMFKEALMGSITDKYEETLIKIYYTMKETGLVDKKFKEEFLKDLYTHEARKGVRLLECYTKEAMKAVMKVSEAKKAFEDIRLMQLYFSIEGEDTVIVRFGVNMIFKDGTITMSYLEHDLSRSLGLILSGTTYSIYTYGKLAKQVIKDNRVIFYTELDLHGTLLNYFKIPVMTTGRHILKVYLGTPDDLKKIEESVKEKEFAFEVPDNIAKYLNPEKIFKPLYDFLLLDMLDAFVLLAHYSGLDEKPDEAIAVYEQVIVKPAELFSHEPKSHKKQ